jgi:hypothetical protein
MDVTDVGSNAVHIVATVQRRLTLQHFNNTDPIITAYAPHNSDARISNSPDWPSDMVFDVSYACATLKQWGDPTFIPLIRDRIANINRSRAETGAKAEVGMEAVAGMTPVLNARPGGRGRKTKQALRTPRMTMLTWSWHCGRRMQGSARVKPRRRQTGHVMKSKNGLILHRTKFSATRTIDHVVSAHGDK